MSASAIPHPVELLRELIRFDTTNPPGNEGPCVDYVRSVLESAGCPTETYALDPARPNLVSRLEGGNAPPLLLYGHVDVVTTVGQAWSRSPFEGLLEDGHVWGRGALDMKSGVAMLVTAFLRARTEGVELPGDVILAILSDEENLGEFGARFLVEQHPEVFEGVRHALGEVGGFSLHLFGRRFYPVEVAQKQVCWLKATIRGTGGHGALPARGGTMARLAEMLAALDAARLPVHDTPAAREMIEHMAAVLDEPERGTLLDLLDPSSIDDALPRLGPRAPGFEGLMRNTVNATIVRGGSKINVIPSEVVVELDGRLLPGFEPADLIAELEPVVGPDVELALVRHDPGPAEPDLGLFETLADVLRELDPEGVPVPMLVVGVTDGRYFSRLGIQTYGFLPLRLPEEFPVMLVHNADERVPAAAVEFGAEAVYRVLGRFGDVA